MNKLDFHPTSLCIGTQNSYIFDNFPQTITSLKLKDLLPLNEFEKIPACITVLDVSMMIRFDRRYMDAVPLTIKTLKLSNRINNSFSLNDLTRIKNQDTEYDINGERGNLIHFGCDCCKKIRCTTDRIFLIK